MNVVTRPTEMRFLTAHSMLMALFIGFVVSTSAVAYEPETPAMNASQEVTELPLPLLFATRAEQKTVFAPYKLDVGNFHYFAKPGPTIPGGLGGSGGLRYSRNETQ